LKQNDKAI